VNLSIITASWVRVSSDRGISMIVKLNCRSIRVWRKIELVR
jgi:hypothetical protein